MATEPKAQHRAAPTALGFVPGLTVLLLLGPVVCGLLGTALPALGLLRPEGAGALSGGPIASMLALPGLGQGLWLSLKTGVISTILALAIALLLVAGWHGSRAFQLLERALSPLLSVPHGAAALGVAFLIAPSGWVARLLSPWGTGWTRPPDLLILQDPGGWALILGLVVKELPFLLLMILAALPQAAPGPRLMVARSLGYGRVMGWMLCVAPAVYRQIRLPVYAVLAYGMSNVDMALVLGPNLPPSLAVLVVQEMTAPDLARHGPGAAAALVQLAAVCAVLGLWRLAEAGAARIGAALIWRGARGLWAERLGAGLGLGLAGLSALLVLGGLLGHLAWSLAGRWRFPAALPEGLRLRTWARQGPEILETSALTLCLAFCVAFVALILVIGCLEAEHRRGRALSALGLWILYVPLLAPQVAFLPGLQIGLLHLGVGQGLWPVVLTHLVFVIPYVFLTLAGPYRAWDARLGVVGASLGASRARVLWRLRLPMLLRAILVALAVGMAVSVGQYLPTLLTSGGRVSTLTTEALALASGGDRRAIGAWALALTLAAWAPFGVALLVPGVLYRNRRGMSDG